MFYSCRDISHIYINSTKVTSGEIFERKHFFFIFLALSLEDFPQLIIKQGIFITITLEKFKIVSCYTTQYGSSVHPFLLWLPSFPLPSFFPSFLPSLFLPFFLPSFLTSFLLSFLFSFLPFFLPSSFLLFFFGFLPSYLLWLPTLLPSYLPSFLPFFLTLFLYCEGHVN